MTSNYKLPPDIYNLATKKKKEMEKDLSEIMNKPIRLPISNVIRVHMERPLWVSDPKKLILLKKRYKLQ